MRHHPDGVVARDFFKGSRHLFCALPVDEIITALDSIYDAHLTIAAKDFIAEDFYEGSMIYDFKQKKMYLCDFDFYHPRPFINERGQLFGSRLFMAPEEFQKYEQIDETTNVFMLGRTALYCLLTTVIQKMTGEAQKQCGRLRSGSER